MPTVPFPGDPPSRVPDELDRATLSLCRAGDSIAFRAFVIRYQRPVFACLSRMLGRGPHVEDFAQDVFLRAHRAFPMFDLEAKAKPSTWLLTIATRVALDARKRRAVPSRPLEDGADVSHQVTPESEWTRRELGIRLESAAAKLPDDQRAALVLAEYHGFSMTEIAQAMAVPEATAKTRLFRARERMRVLLGDAWGERGES